MADNNLSQWDLIFDEFEDSLLKISQPTTIALVAVYAPLFVISLVGNVSVVLVVCRMHYMRKNKNYFLVNLCIADLLVTVLCVPVTLANVIYRRWIFGRVICKLAAFSQGVAVASSIYSLAALSLDRYLAIKHPALFRRLSNQSNGLKLIGIIWLVSMLFMMPMLYVHQVDRQQFPEFGFQLSVCIERWSSTESKSAFAGFMLVVAYVLPCSVIVACHYVICKTLNTTEIVTQEPDGGGGSECKRISRKRIALMLITLVVLFVVCWLPYNLASLYVDITNSRDASEILPFTLLLAHANSAANPVIYWILNIHFRNGLSIILTRGCTAIAGGKSRNGKSRPPLIVVHGAPVISRDEDDTLSGRMSQGDSV
ncbi:PREDICTED: orexin receptor type 2-like [Priapulus caudatus]|uniref:Orexin receptor type 2-like n=1 Tax=Priapulus caudatus TaxID=37621 RepID=A0ABM1DVY8_PRICU|nr:PREDICTED: orexin receptor type 2-like [Priapulus caudatus]